MVFKNVFPLKKKTMCLNYEDQQVNDVWENVYLGNDAKHLNVFVVSLGGLCVDVVIPVFLKVSTRNLCVQ